MPSEKTLVYNSFDSPLRIQTQGGNVLFYWLYIQGEL